MLEFTETVMRNILTLAIAVFLVVQTGCAAGARVGGPERGVGVGAAVGTTPPPPPPSTAVPPR